MSGYILKPDHPAMPLTVETSDGVAVYCGMSVREYFAAQAMQGILANRTYDPPRRNKLKGMAEDAVSAADALIEALNANKVAE